MVFFSLVIPIYNTPEILLRKCIDSILNQTYQNFEVFLVNDGSTNNAYDVCLEYSENAKINIISQDNQGVSVARNTGINSSHGEWIMFVDPDDELTENCLELFFENIDKDDEIVSCSCFLNTDSGTKEEYFYPENKIFKSKKDKNEFYIHALWKLSNWCAPWGKAFRRSFINKNKINFNPELRRSQDIIFNLYSVYYCKQLKYINKPVYIYNATHMDNLHCKFNPNLASLYVLFAQARYDWMKNTNSFSDSVLSSYYLNGVYQILWQILSVGPFHKDNPMSLNKKFENAKTYLNLECFSVLKNEVSEDYSIKERVRNFFIRRGIWLPLYLWCNK
ncbi:MAG: glycosyltransferase [Treponema sp.]|nr:glycosyltransferase [Treponema sp.]